MTPGRLGAGIVIALLTPADVIILQPEEYF